MRIICWLQKLIEQLGSKEALCKDQPWLASGLSGWWPLQGAGEHSIAQPTYMGCHDYVAGEFDGTIHCAEEVNGAHLQRFRGVTHAPRTLVRRTNLVVPASDMAPNVLGRRAKRREATTRHELVLVAHALEALSP